MSKKVLIIRFSALGDVAISVPVVKALVENYPEDDFTFISRPFCKDLFCFDAPNFHFIGVDVKTKYSGLIGLIRLFRDIKIRKFDLVCDIHSTLRGRILCALSSLFGVKRVKISKDRRNRRKLLRKNNKVLKPLTPSYKKYSEVFRKAGFLKNNLSFIDKEKKQYFKSEAEIEFGTKKSKWIGVAPFAQHKGKIYPLDKMKEVVEYFSKENKIFLFGGGKEEMEVFNDWKKTFKNVEIASLKGLLFDIKVMCALDVMISMDSANMHLASIVQTPVVSVWGATHIYAGFYGLNQSLDDIVDLDMTCRPCSIYGNKPCFRKDYACLNDITPKMIINKVEKRISYEKNN